MRLWLALLLAAAPAAAQTRAAAVSASGASSAAGAAVTVQPAVLAKRHELDLRLLPSLAAGGAFLADRPALMWLSENRPQIFPAMVTTALDLRDLEKTLGAYEDPRLLREALLTRDDSDKANQPARLMKLAERTPSLAPKRDVIAAALLDWSRLGPKTREELGRRGFDEAQWAGQRLSRRFSVMRDVMERRAAETITVPVGHEDYAAQYEKSFRMLAGLMSSEEIEGHANELERAKRFAAGLRAAEKAAAAGSRAARALAAAAGAADLDEGEALLDAAARGSLPPAPAEPRYDLTDAETGDLQNRLMNGIAEALSGTEIGNELAETMREMPVAMGLRPLSGTTGGHYSRLEGSGLVVLNTNMLAKLLADIGRKPRDLLTDREALADAVVLYSQIMAHELTHHRQRLRKGGLSEERSAAMYTREDEMEANNAQAAFMRQKRAADPAFAARETRLLAKDGEFANALRQAEAHAADHAAMNRWLEYGYARIPTFERATIRLLASGLREQERMAPAVERIEAELARRRRLTRAERLVLERSGLPGGRASVEDMKTSVLRRALAEWTQSARLVFREAWRIGRETREQIERLAHWRQPPGD